MTRLFDFSGPCSPCYKDRQLEACIEGMLKWTRNHLQKSPSSVAGAKQALLSHGSSFPKLALPFTLSKRAALPGDQMSQNYFARRNFLYLYTPVMDS